MQAQSEIICHCTAEIFYLGLLFYSRHPSERVQGIINKMRIYLLLQYSDFSLSPFSFRFLILAHKLVRFYDKPMKTALQCGNFVITVLFIKGIIIIQLFLKVGYFLDQSARYYLRKNIAQNNIYKYYQYRELIEIVICIIYQLFRNIAVDGKVRIKHTLNLIYIKPIAVILYPFIVYQALIQYHLAELIGIIVRYDCILYNKEYIRIAEDGIVIHRMKILFVYVQKQISVVIACIIIYKSASDNHEFFAVFVLGKSVIYTQTVGIAAIYKSGIRFFLKLPVIAAVKIMLSVLRYNLESLYRLIRKNLIRGIFPEFIILCPILLIRQQYIRNSVIRIHIDCILLYAPVHRIDGHLEIIMHAVEVIIQMSIDYDIVCHAARNVKEHQLENDREYKNHYENVFAERSFLIQKSRQSHSASLSFHIFFRRDTRNLFKYPCEIVRILISDHLTYLINFILILFHQFYRRFYPVFGQI